MSVAPYHVVVTIVNSGEGDSEKLAETIYQKLLAAEWKFSWMTETNVPASSFKDADILGIPVRLPSVRKPGRV
jgi:prolyl-tRNA synthetase